MIESHRPFGMERNVENLYRKLRVYGESEAYPFHMPGHKRNSRLMREVYGEEPGSLYGIDMTEIDGFDDLHHAEGILKEAMDRMAGAVGAKRSYFVVNGSTGGILAAMYGGCPAGSRIVAARNCHRSVAHGIQLLSLRPYYVYPQMDTKLGISMGINCGNIDDIFEKAGDNSKEIAAVVVTSPTYEGVVSDIAGIAETAHRHGCLLIVDEAHGAHLPFGRISGLPESAVSCGADLVIQSLHKTLPALTQSAALHICSDRVDIRRIEAGLRIFETSSPSYVMMAGMDACMGFMAREGEKRLAYLGNMLDEIYRDAESWEELYLLNEADIKKNGNCFGFDRTKLVIGTRNLTGCGGLIHRWLAEEYQLQPEMSVPEYVILMTTVGDIPEGFNRLKNALREIDGRLKRRKRTRENGGMCLHLPEACQILYAGEAVQKEGEQIPVEQAKGRICQEMAYIYPPGIPFLMPGERIEEEHIELLLYYREYGREIHGLADGTASCIMVVKEEMEK